MAKWIRIAEDTAGRTFTITDAMIVPGGMLVRTATMEGLSMVFVPSSGPIYALEEWLDTNSINT